MNAKYYKSLVLLRKISMMRRRFTLPIQLIKSRIWLSPSYYPELPQKSKWLIFLEMMVHIMRYGSIEWHYFSYGLDIKGWRCSDEYIDDNWFIWKSSMLNTILPTYDYTVILRDKILFSELLTIWGFSTPRILIRIDNDESIDNVVDCIFAKLGGGAIFKPFGGQCGGGIFCLYMKEGKMLMEGKEIVPLQLKTLIQQQMTKSPYIVQEIVQQHEVLNALYDKSVNTLRLVTIIPSDSSTAVPFSAVLRVGTHGNIVDNWAKGGLAIGVDMKTGKLKKYGFYKHGFGTKTEVHPDSGITFSDIALPYFHEAVDSACALHQRMNRIRIIGWDIAFTPSGPTFIEGNDNMEISINQETNGGLKKQLLELIN